jgi:hypothetical protein
VVVVVAWVTTCFTTLDVLLAKFESPLYTALMLSVPPVVSVEVVKLAEPPLNAPVPRSFVPCMNITISPSGGAPSEEVTTAVKVTACP